MFLKKYRYIFIGLLFFTVLLVASPVHGAGLVNCKTDPCSWSDLIILINDVIKFLIFTLGIPMVTIVIVVSGVQIVWNPSRSTTNSVWKNRLQNAFLGLAIMLSAWLIVKAVVWGLTDGGDAYNLQGEFQKDPVN